ncbi:MAG: nitroreductase family protein [Bacteroidetes bacterium]|nr:MAG: nitroreductase family protein [Bacteroidota bacterium]
MSVLSTIKKRFSPYTYEKTSISLEEIESAFEAARWAPSGYNSQPWRFVFASRDNLNFETLLSFAVEANREWMQHSGAIVVILAKTLSDYNGKKDESAEYCTGLAVGQMLVELTALGLQAHQIGGFDHKALSLHLKLPNGVLPMAMMAIGVTEEEPKDDRQRESLTTLISNEIS